jgi:hypothetical protein
MDVLEAHYSGTAPIHYSAAGQGDALDLLRILDDGPLAAYGTDRRSRTQMYFSAHGSVYGAVDPSNAR